MSTNSSTACTLGGLLFVVALACTAGCRRPQPPAAGDPAPLFQLETLAAGRYYLQEQRGQVALLVFWTTFCKGCKRQLSDMAALQRELGVAGLRVATVCSDPEQRAELLRLVPAVTAGLPVLLDPGGRVTEAYGVTTVPTTVIVARDGTAAFRWVGYEPADLRRLRSMVERALAQR